MAASLCILIGVWRDEGLLGISLVLLEIIFWYLLLLDNRFGYIRLEITSYLALTVVYVAHSVVKIVQVNSLRSIIHTDGFFNLRFLDGVCGKRLVLILPFNISPHASF